MEERQLRFETILTVVDLRERCLAGDVQAWRSFIRSYGPLTRHLLQHYFPNLGPQLLPEVFRAARAAPGGFWQGFAGTGQKEFLLHLRRHVLGVGRERRGPAPETPLTPKSFASLLQHFPQAQREMVILSLKGYPPATIAPMVRSSPTTVESVVSDARQKLERSLGPASPPFPGDQDALFERIERERTEDCLPDRFYVHFEDGGTVSWRDRDNAERHFEICWRCLLQLTDYRETEHFFRVLSPLEEETENALAQGLGVSHTERKRPSLWDRLLRRSGAR